MVRRRGGRGRNMRHEDNDDDDDNVSLASVETLWTVGSDDGDFYDTHNKPEEESIDEAIEELTEKRATTRVAALEKLYKHILQYLPAENISATFVDNVLNCLRKPSESEAVLGSKILSVMSLIIGTDDERFYQRCKNVLEPLARRSRSEKAKSSAIHSLAVISFVCSVEEENDVELLGLLDKYFDVKILGPICVSALQAWGLVASAFPDAVLASADFINSNLPRFLKLLQHSSVDVRSAAGENIAMLFESAQKCGVTLPCDSEIVETFRAMSKDSSKKNSKKDRKVQRLVFRDVHATLANGDSPHVTFTLKNEQLDVHSWKSVLQFEAIKACLNIGLQEHLKYNNAVRQILDLPETLEERVVDRRDIFDKKSSSRKQRSNELKGERRRKQHMLTSFYEDS